jgi:hypothetical protein
MGTPRKATAGPISELAALIKEFRAVSPDMRIERGRTFVETLGRRTEFVPLIQSVLDDPRLLEDIAGRSYPHVNKFDKIVLVGGSEPQDYRLTLHLWRPPYPESPFGQEMIHGHRFNFWSAIITGTLSTELFEEYPASPGDGKAVLHKYRYIPEVNREMEFQDFYEFAGRVSLASGGVCKKRAGDSYYLDASVIHQVILPRQITTCSLVLRGPRLSEHSCIYNSGYPQHGVYLANKMFSPNELQTRLHHLMSELGAG